MHCYSFFLLSYRINAWLLCTFPANKSLFSRGWVQLRERLCLKERVIGRSQGAVLLNFPWSKAPQWGYPGQQISLCPLFTVPVTRATRAGTKGGLFLLSFPRMTALCWAERQTGGAWLPCTGTEDSFNWNHVFRFPSIRHCLNVNTCGYSLIRSGKSCLHGSGCY